MRSTALRAIGLSCRAPEVNFEDHEGAFRHKTTWEVARALSILRLCSYDTLTDNSLGLLEWSRRLRLHRPLLRSTLYDQFVGGETTEELRRCMRGVAKAGLRAMLAATMEEDVGGKGSEDVYQNNCRRIVAAIRMAADETLDPMVQLKLSGLMSANLLVQLGQVYRETDSKLKVVEAIAEGLAGNTIQIAPLTAVLNHADEESLKRAVGRLKEIGLEASRRGVKVLVDAEFTYLNEGLSSLALAGAAAFNARTPLFWNTYQCYLKDARSKVLEELRLVTDGLGCHFGAKVVRGAYMLQERSRALHLCLQDPICEDYASTCDNYDRVLSFLLDTTSALGSKCQFIVASHNEESVKFAIRRMVELNMDRRLVCFGQLYGMCDQVSYPLARDGFAVYKSIPYGTIEEVLPYLARRAVENKSVVLGARKEQTLLSKELRRRILKALWH